MSAPTHKGKTILDAMKTRWAAITAGSNYNYTYTNLVKISPASPQSEGVYINPGTDDVGDEESSGSISDFTMPVNIDLVQINDTKDAYLMEADILKSTRTDLTWGGLAIHTKHVNSYNNPSDQEGNLIASRRVQLEVLYRVIN